MENEARTRTAAHEEIGKMQSFELIINALSEPNPRLKEADVTSMLKTSTRGLETARAKAKKIITAEELL